MVATNNASTTAQLVNTYDASHCSEIDLKSFSSLKVLTKNQLVFTETTVKMISLYTILSVYLLICLATVGVNSLRTPPKNAFLNKRTIEKTSFFSLYDQMGRVTMYTKEGCPHCEKAKELLTDKHGLALTLVDIEGENQ